MHELNRLIFAKIGENLISSGLTLIEQGNDYANVDYADYVEVQAPDGFTDCVVVIDHGNLLVENCKTIPSKLVKVSLASPTAFEEVTAAILSIYK